MDGSQLKICFDVKTGDTHTTPEGMRKLITHTRGLLGEGNLCVPSQSKTGLRAQGWPGVSLQVEWGFPHTGKGLWLNISAAPEEEAARIIYLFLNQLAQMQN